MNEVEELIRASENWVDAIDVVAGIANCYREIESIELIELPPVPAGKTHAGKSPDIAPLVPEALDLRERYGVPYWMSVMFVAQKTHIKIPNSVLRAANFHQDMPAHRIEVKAESNLVQNLRSLHQSTNAGRILTIRSVVRTTAGELRHIPMLDFRLRSTEENRQTIVSILQEIKASGILLDSGRSYHFYGFELMDAQALQHFLGRALLFTPLVDHRWIAHQLIEAACALRISRGGVEQIIPQIVEVITIRKSA